MELLNGTVDSDGETLLETTTVIVFSEMGRTPVYNASFGKDHWPYTSVMMMGAGIRKGMRFGHSDNKLVGAPIAFDSGSYTENGQLLSTENLIAGLLESFDIDPREELGDIPPFQACFL